MRQNVSSNSPFEPEVAFSRAVRAGNQVFVAGTVGRAGDGSIAEGVYEQAARQSRTSKRRCARPGHRWRTWCALAST